MNDRPYTCKTLSARWGCSGETIRQMIKRGDIKAFQVGVMYRIPASEVERYETCLISQSDAWTAASVSPGMRTERDDAFVLRHAPERKQKPKPAMSSSVN